MDEHPTAHADSLADRHRGEHRRPPKRESSPAAYGDTVLAIAGCTCAPRRRIQELDEKGSFTIEHDHAPECEKTLNALQWEARARGIAGPDYVTDTDRRLRRQGEQGLGL